jgi:ABC-type multidrug transport system ATPase subunit
MEIALHQAGKRYNFNWIFKSIDLHLTAGSRWVFLGSNGSGKSTLMQLISGSTILSEGSIVWKRNDQVIPQEEVYQYISIAAPYLELIEEFTLEEHIRFHFSVKKPLNQMEIKEILEISGLANRAQLKVGYFSSGMKQRLKLLLAILSDTPLLLLDEPLSNLDKDASKWYLNMIERFGTNRTIVVCSNSVEEEYKFCSNQINLNLQ